MAKDEKNKILKKVVDTKKSKPKGFQKGNREGAKKVQYDREEIAAKRLDQNILFRVINLHLFSPPELLKEVIDNPQTNMLEAIVCRSLLNAQYKSEVSTLDYYISRLIGKIPEKIITEQNNPFKDMTLEEMKAKHAELAKSNRQTFDNIMKEKKINDRNGTGDSSV